MAISAICVQCGRPKRRPLGACKACGYAPESEYQTARALILSSKRRIGGTLVGRDAAMLKALSAQIVSGRFYEFDPEEERRALDAYRRGLAEDSARQANRRRKLLVAAIVGIVALGVWLYLTGWKR